MYLKDARSYFVGTEQRAARAPFLILMQSDDAPIGEHNNLRAIVRKVALAQLGHWMMGKARIKGESITVSGSYGHDGLPVTVKRAIWEQGVPLPDDLYDAWNKGGGWNGCGSEALAMRAWALQTFPG